MNSKIEPDLSNLENKFLELMLAIPNIPSADTPMVVTRLLIK